MMRRSIAWLALLLALAAPMSAAVAGSVRAFVDRNQVALGETVTLNVEADDVADAQAPDFDVLLPDFVIVGRNSQQNFSNVNGRLQRSRIWAVALQPRRAGTLTIPSLNIGSERTDPIQLEVSASAGTAHGNVFIEYQAEPARAWVGQQVLLRVRLFYAGNLAQGQLDEPQDADAEVRKLGDDVQYQAQRGGKTYRVIERHYALFAHKPGKLELPPLHFRGQVQDAGFGGFFGAGRAVSAQSAPLDLVVDAIPAHGGGDWLPARKLTLELQGVPADGKATVGKPLTLTLVLKAEGLPFEALPEPSLPTIDGAAVYPDKPVDLTRNDGQWLSGSRERKFALVPTRAGTLTLPPISLQWWNTSTGKAETATLPAHTLHVVAVAGSTAPAATPAPAPASSSMAPAAKSTATAMAPSARGWRIAAIGLFALWLATLLAWTWQARGRRAVATPAAVAGSPDVAALRRAFGESGDVASLAHGLLAWARAERPGLRNLGELAALLHDPVQREAIDALQRQRYGGGTAADVAGIVAAFRRGLAWRKADAKSSVAGLPPLYPDS